MTQQANFKRRVRERMAKTGERYAAARRVLVEQQPDRRRRTWVSEPEFDDEVIIGQTGRSWDDWCDLIDGWVSEQPDVADRRDHAAIARFVQHDEGVDGWWAQSVTVGYERITGRRLPNQMKDGTFTANKSMTVAIDPDEMRALLLDDDDRRELFGDLTVELRSKPTTRRLRLGLDTGTALVSIDPASNGRSKIVVAHSQLPDVEAVEQWKFFWSEWLQALDDG